MERGADAAGAMQLPQSWSSLFRESHRLNLD
jgi:hypothetical protein